MKVRDMILKICLILTLFINPVVAEDAPRQVQDEQTYGEVLKDIYLNGELDDRSIFMVLGFDQAKEFAGSIGKMITSKDDLKEAGVEVKDGVNEFVEIIKKNPQVVKSSYEYAKETLKEVITAPKDSLAKIPTAFKVSMNYAKAGYYESENEVIGGFKYAGHATWFMVKGSYYLLLEAPARAVLAAAFGAFAVPGAVALNSLYAGYRFVIGVGNAAIQLSFEALKTVSALLIQTATLAYSAISTTTVALVTSVIALPVYIIQGLRKAASLVSLKTIRSEILSSDENEILDRAQQSLKEFARELNLLSLGELKMNFARAGSSYRVYLKKGKDTLVRMRIRTSMRKAKFKAFINRALYKDLKEKGFDKEKLNSILINSLAAL